MVPLKIRLPVSSVWIYDATYVWGMLPLEKTWHMSH